MEDVKACLIDLDHSIFHPTSLKNRWALYYLGRFFICGRIEFLKFIHIDFNFYKDPHGKLV